MRRVAVTGFGVVSAAGRGPAETARRLREGRSCIGPITLFDVSALPCRLAGEVRAQGAGGPSRASALLEPAARDALESAGLGRGARADVILGTTLGGMERGTAFMRDVLARGIDRADGALLEDFLPGCQPLALARRYGLRGRSLVVNNACSSGTDAIGLAFERIRDGASDRVLAGGYEPLCEFVLLGFTSLQIVSRTACRPFDRDRDGILLGEGAAVLVLEEEGAARARGAEPLAWVRGFGAAADGFHMTQPEPEGTGIAEAIRRALGSAGVGPRDIGYLNLHGTGTRQNDLAEYRGLARAFGGDLASVACSSTKGLSGHALGAAGALEAVYTLLALREGFVPANVGLEHPDPEMAGLPLARETAAREYRFALSDSIGFGGASSAVVFEKA